MKKFIKFVEQRENKDCILACLAMLTDLEYDEIKKSFQNDFSKSGVLLSIVISFLIDRNISPITINFDRMTTRSKKLWTKPLMIPFAESHLVIVRHFIDAESDHAIVMDAEGRIFDPGDTNVKSLDEYYEVLNIVGCFYDFVQ